MRVAKNIKYEIARSSERFILLKKKINKSIENNPEGPIAQLENISKLNYFFVIDCKDVSGELGLDSKIDTNSVLFGNIEKNKKFLDHINGKNKQPSYFKKLGLLYEISGCYLIATTKKSKKNISIYNSINTVSCKLDIDNLPKEFKQMCTDYENYNIDNNITINPGLMDMFNFKEDEKDRIIDDIISSLVFSDIPSQDLYPLYDISDFYQNPEFGGLNIEDVIESKIQDIYDVTFLEQVMETALESENFELCSKIRDRISKIKNN